jgi:hypothetical protein
LFLTPFATCRTAATEGMKLFGWRKGASSGNSAAVAAWRRSWAAAIDGSTADPPELRQQLEALEPDVDLEVELEMLDALVHLREVQRTAAAGALPVVETHHRVIGADRCHFTAPASLPSGEHQANGRLLLTSARAVFVGGGRTTATPWHAVHEIARVERDVLLVGADHAPAAHFRFNTYGDAVLCVFLAGHLRRAR